MKYTYDEVAKAKSIADKRIDNTLSSILKPFDTETKRIDKMFDKVSYFFNNEEEKQKLLQTFQEVEKEKNNSEYSEYIDMDYEIDGKFFFVNCFIHRGRFADEQRKKIAQNITIEL